MKSRILILPLMLGLLPGLTFASNNISQKKQQLAHLNQSIKTLKKTIHLSQTQKNTYNQQLAKTEIAMGASERRLSKTKTKLNTSLKSLNKTEGRQDALRRQIQTQQKILGESISSAYQLGREQYLKMLLNQENPNTLNRNINYYHYMTAARMSEIKAMRRNIIRLNAISAQYKTQARQLQNIKAVQESQTQTLLQQKYHRRHLLNTLNANLNTKQARLNQLVSNKQNLENVFKELKSHFYFFVPGSSFSEARHSLPWPIQHGYVIQSFNTPLASGRVKTSGILIKASMGAPVHAIFKGKVVFANWLRGYGLLVIVLHGKHVMTLYAHAQSLFVKNGETVQPGQEIATVGNTGGFKNTSLYFEIRINGIAVNPTLWLRKAS
jgi:murein hydrolase activator